MDGEGERERSGCRGVLLEDAGCLVGGDEGLTVGGGCFCCLLEEEDFRFEGGGVEGALGIVVLGAVVCTCVPVDIVLDLDRDGGATERGDV